jgi:hypothetical protein
MSRPVRRVVTGHDEAGKAVVAFDGPAPVVFKNAARPGYSLTQLWMTDGAPALVDNGPDPTARPVTIEPAAKGTVIRVIEFPPDSEATRALSAEQAKAIFQKMGSGSAATVRSDSRHPLMHRTKTVDYGLVMEGSITLVLDDADVALTAGDVVVQRGTNHAWSNRSGKPCRMLFVLIDGHLSADVAAAITAFDAVPEAPSAAHRDAQ